MLDERHVWNASQDRLDGERADFDVLKLANDRIILLGNESIRTAPVGWTKIGLAVPEKYLVGAERKLILESLQVGGLEARAIPHDKRALPDMNILQSPKERQPAKSTKFRFLSPVCVQIRAEHFYSAPN
jgi:hypothetical protein